MTSCERQLLVCALALHKMWRNQAAFEEARPVIESFKQAATLLENENTELVREERSRK
jgi:hypothetical protein